MKLSKAESDCYHRFRLHFRHCQVAVERYWYYQPIEWRQSLVS